MSWPIGYGKHDILYEIANDGGVYANGIAVTGPDGWIEIPSPVSAIVRGAPAVIAIRIRVASDAHGLPFLYAEDVQVGTQYYTGIFGLLTSEVRLGTTGLSEAIHAEIDRRIRHARRAAGMSRSGMMSRATTPAMPKLYETWTGTIDSKMGNG